ncbi:MAG: protein-L-isoaspartate(D-aspartate) O-methyltransferase [Gammaproteobacteria bacterium]|nr:protein-L-isoaspartate(D-aspartate) O-methyltransferase [Gammaproteobacteria bacterium]
MSQYQQNGIGMTSQRTRERLVTRLRDQGISDNEVLQAIRVTPRHLFIDEALASRAYEDTALPIGYGQTISQPYIVARMTQAAIQNVKRGKVLEIGTGSGYQTAVLAQLFEEVYSVERILALQKKARQLLYELKHYNISYKYDDGHLGWEEHAPYDVIIVTAAASEIPEQLLQQLAIGGHLLIPSGQSNKQQLHHITRNEQGFESHVLDDVRFVPLLGGTVTQ